MESISEKHPYTFYCTICGKPFSVVRCDARTCSKICRVVLSQLSRYGMNVGVEQTTAEEKDEIEKKNVRLGGATPAEEKNTTSVKKLLGKKDKTAPVISGTTHTKQNVQKKASD